MEIKQQYEHSKFGNFMFKVCAKSTKTLLKNKWLYYLLACTWGIIMTLLGVIITLILAICAGLSQLPISFKAYHWIYAISVGPDYWGGFEMGLMFCRDQKSTSDYLDTHEFGHTFQNCILGPLFPFLVAIPSASRYWIFTFREKKGKQNAPYDSVWFEDAASECGKYAHWYLNHLIK